MKKLALLLLTLLAACDGAVETQRASVWLPTTSSISLDEYALQRTHDLTGMDAPAIWHDPFIVAPGDARSLWYVDGVYPTILPDGVGGVARLDSGTGLDGFSLARVTGYGGLAGIVGDVGTGARFYALFRFRIATPVTATCAIRLGLARADAGATLSLGVRGTASTEFFRFSRGVTGALSSIPVDDAWHQGELWSPGDGRAYGSIDVEDTKSFAVAPFGASLAPWMLSASGAVVDPSDPVQVDVDDAVYVFPAAGDP